MPRKSGSAIRQAGLSRLPKLAKGYPSKGGLIKKDAKGLPILPAKRSRGTGGKTSGFSGDAEQLANKDQVRGLPEVGMKNRRRR